MSKREAIIPPGMEAVYEKIRYSPAVKVGNMIYVSGQIGRDASMELVASHASMRRLLRNWLLVSGYGA